MLLHGIIVCVAALTPPQVVQLWTRSNHSRITIRRQCNLHKSVDGNVVILFTLVSPLPEHRTTQNSLRRPSHCQLEDDCPFYNNYLKYYYIMNITYYRQLRVMSYILCGDIPRIGYTQLHVLFHVFTTVLGYYRGLHIYRHPLLCINFKRITRGLGCVRAI